MNNKDKHFSATVTVTSKENRNTRFGNPYTVISFNYNGTEKGTAYNFTPEMMNNVNVGDLIHISCECRKEKFYNILSIEIMQTNKGVQI